MTIRIARGLLLVLAATALTVAGLPLAATTAAAARAATPTPDVCSPRASTPAGGMMGGMMTRQEFDLMFIDMMIAHHGGAVAMAEVAAVRAEHPEVRDLARRIVSTQQAEVDQMRTWRDLWYPGAASMPVAGMAEWMAGMMGGMPGMMATPGPRGPMHGTSAGDLAMMMDPEAARAEMCAAPEPFDQAFLTRMIPHHESAILMAEVAQRQATHQEIKELATAMISTQQAEIEQMRGWLALWYGGTPVAAAGGDGVTEVPITLTEFAVVASTRAFEAGRSYRFVVTNAGTIPHEFMVMPAMPGIGGMDMETLDGMALGMIPADELSPGRTLTLDVTFPGNAAGSWELVCAVPGHYDAGMSLAVAVR